MDKAERNKKIASQIQVVTKRGLTSKTAAMTVLVKDGIYTPKGNLKAEFGGKGWKRKASASNAGEKKRA